MKDRSTILRENPLLEVMKSRGHEFIKVGHEWATRCPFHADGTPSLYIHEEKQAWLCRAGCGGGSVIDFVMRADGIDLSAAMRKLAGEEPRPLPANPKPPVDSKLVKTYDYRDELGALLYQVCRFEPKSFRQRQPKGADWKWTMDGARRVLYRLPELLNPKSGFIWLVEGEKDADNLHTLGLTATCNVGGAGKWLDGYTASLAGRDVILCGDTDEPGRKHVKLVLESLAGRVKSARVVMLPDTFKDVSEFIEDFADAKKAAHALIDLAESSPCFDKGLNLPIFSADEMERNYIASLRTSAHAVDLSHWLPSFALSVRPLQPGEVCSVIAATGCGKTMILQNIAIACRVPSLLFEMELPAALTFERFAAMANRVNSVDVENAYKDGKVFSRDRFSHVFTCPKSKLDPAEIHTLIQQSELKIGTKPSLVLVDYIQLIGSQGASRYEKASAVMEELKVIAKAAHTVIIVASQVNRATATAPELCDGKDSGSIENSSGLVLGAWRYDESNPMKMKIRVLKNTKGKPGRVIDCTIQESLLIAEDAREVKQETML